MLASSQFEIGDTVRSTQIKGKGSILDTTLIGGKRYYVVDIAGEEYTLPESDLERPRDQLDRLAEGKYGYAADFDLYARATALYHAFRERGMSCLSNSRLDPKPHQVFVAHRALQDLHPRYLLSDEVGLGKTIEAGLILKELKARGLAERILIVTPASLCEQWHGEMTTKFNESFAIYKGATIRENLSRNPQSNPWSRDTHVITSLQFARGQLSPIHRAAERRRQIDQRENCWIDEIEWDLVIFDEAHHLRRYIKGSSIRDGRETTQAYRLARALEERTKSLLLLTATPLQLSEYDTFSLIELLDPTLFPSYRTFCEYIARLGGQQWQAIAELDRALHTRSLSRLWRVFLQALRSFQAYEISEDFWNSITPAIGASTIIGANKHFTLKTVRQDYTNLFTRRDESRLTAYTRQLADHGLETFLITHRDVICDWIGRQHKLSQIMIRNRKREVLRGEIVERRAHKVRVTLTPEELAFYERISAYIKTSYARVTNKTMAVGFILTTFRKLLVSSRRALAASLERRASHLEEVLRSHTMQLGRNVSEDDLEELRDTIDIIEQCDALLQLTGSASEVDIRTEIFELREMARSARSILTDSKANKLLEAVQTILDSNRQEKVLIFTQFRETQTYLQTLFDERGYKVALFHGEYGNKAYSKLREFERFKRDCQVRIMIATDVGGEGLNFQFCHVLFNYDLPWNPMNIEQRIGRLDRIGQEHSVRIYNFFLEDTLDGRILDVLHERIKIFEQTIGTLDPIIGEEIESVIKAMSLTDSRDEVERRLRDLEQTAQRRIRESLEANEKLADFIMDARSFRRDIVDRVMKQELLVTNQDIELLVRTFLGRYHTSSRPNTIIETADNIVTIQVPERFREDCRHCYGVELHKQYFGTFDPSTAIAEETIDFFAFGHPLFDTIIEYCRDRAHNNFKLEAALRILYDADLAGYEGVQFNYCIVAEGVRTYRKFVSIVLNRDGIYNEQISQRLFTLRADEQDTNSEQIFFNRQELQRLKKCSQSIVNEIAEYEFEAAAHRNEQEYGELQSKIQRLFSYRISHQREELAHRQAQLSTAQHASQDTRVRLMEGQINATNNRIRELEKQCTDELQRLQTQYQVHSRIEPLAIALVKVLAPK